MHRTLTLAVVLLALVVSVLYIQVRAQVVTPRPEALRFQVLVNEPVASTDRRGVVPGVSALVMRDRTTGQCFVAVTLGDAISLSPAPCNNSK
jgi:hypothetical protein